MEASKNNKTSHILAGTYDQSPCLHDLEVQKKVSAFQTFRRKIESENLAKNIKCKGHKEHKLEQDERRAFKKPVLNGSPLFSYKQ